MASLSNLSLIPKKGSLALIANWRPLSIFNTIYKLIAKSLENRSKTFMPQWIRPSQTGFVKERHILENIFTAQEAMYWTVSSQKNLALIFLDFEKAYDRVSWIFLKNALIHFGFSFLWVSWIRALYVDASTQILVNGQKGQPFSLGRFVRQGLWASSLPRNFFWGENLGLQWLLEGEGTRDVGIPLGYKISQDIKDVAALAFVKKHLNFWTHRQCSLAARFINVSQTIEASQWFIAG